MKNALLIFVLLQAAVAAAQTKTIFYKESQEDIVNPERGFYIPLGTRAGNFVPLHAAQLEAYRAQPQQPGNAGYAVKVSLIYRGYELDIFKEGPLSESFLQNLQQDFDAVRTAGLKMIIRFAYTNTTKEGNCTDEYKICPPYGDAPRHIVLQHIRQLKPLLQHNADVIAVMQEGFIGIWGENYFTDYFGDASTNGAGKILDSSWLHRNELLKELLDALPKTRMVQVRTPQIKQKFVYGPSAVVNSAPLKIPEAFNGTYKSRIGFHNDCFLASEDDYGTYYDYGSSLQPRKPANALLRKYIAADTKFTAVGGETCDDAFSPQNDCAPLGYAEKEMAAMHFSYLNAAYNNQVNNDWDSAGCMKSIKQNLGYRFVVKSLKYTSQVTAGGNIKMTLTINNTGYASPYNERPVKLILKNKTTRKVFQFVLPVDIRKWYSGNNYIPVTLAVAGMLPPGRYDMFLFMPDLYASVAARPEYAIRLANSSLWDAATGYNKLDAVLTVK